MSELDFSNEELVHAFLLEAVKSKDDGNGPYDPVYAKEILVRMSNSDELRAEIDCLITFNREMKAQLAIATDLGQKRFEDAQRLRDALKYAKSIVDDDPPEEDDIYKHALRGIGRLSFVINNALAGYSEKPSLIDALKEAQWYTMWGLDGTFIEFCPCCDNKKENGHAPDCIIGNALKGGAE